MTEVLGGNPLWFMGMGERAEAKFWSQELHIAPLFCTVLYAPAGQGGAGGAAVSRWRARSADGGLSIAGRESFQEGKESRGWG